MARGRRAYVTQFPDGNIVIHPSYTDGPRYKMRNKDSQVFLRSTSNEELGPAVREKLEKCGPHAESSD